MKWDPAKAFPHPVLRPDEGGEGDYPTAEFQTTLEVVRADGAMAVDVSGDFALSDDDLRDLVGRGDAGCVLLVEAPTTRFRRLLRATGYRLRNRLLAGELKGRVEFRPFLVCLRRLVGFKAAGWHADYGKRSFDLYPGSVTRPGQAGRVLDRLGRRKADRLDLQAHGVKPPRGWNLGL